MGSKLAFAARDLRGINTPLKAVLLVLALRADDVTGACWPSLPTIAADAGVRGPVWRNTFFILATSVKKKATRTARVAGSWFAAGESRRAVCGAVASAVLEGEASASASVPSARRSYPYGVERIEYDRIRSINLKS